MGYLCHAGGILSKGSDDSAESLPMREKKTRVGDHRLFLLGGGGVGQPDSGQASNCPTPENKCGFGIFLPSPILTVLEPTEDYVSKTKTDVMPQLCSLQTS